MQVIKTTIDSGWEVAERLPIGRDFFHPQGGEKNWLPATVPGHVHLDLVRAGIIGDPFYRMNERGCQWVDETDWTYRTTFTVDADRLASRGEYGKHFLHFHGLDTLCRVFLNGVKVGEAENFHIPHRFDVTDVLREGENELRVEFDSALRVGRERAEAYLGDGTSDRGKMTYFNFGPRAFIRKPQYMFGWDWGPELVSCGIWQPVELVTVPVAEIGDWQYNYTFGDEQTVEVTISAQVAVYDPAYALQLDISIPTSGLNTFAHLMLEEGSGERLVQWTSPPIKVRLWDVEHDFVPTLEVAGVCLSEKVRGDYISVHLRTGGKGSGIDYDSKRVGFRKIELIREPDPDGNGESFKFRINGVDTFIKGANWIPDHSFPSTITKARLRERLIQASAAGFNMLRIWGGGLYEVDEFYDMCDDLGILVWQDFPFGCSMYPDDLPEFREQVRQEAIIAIRRIRNHPCLALWCGGNENLQLAQGRWSGPLQATKFYGDRLIHEVLPEVLAQEDPNTPYWPNSPYSGTPNRDSTSDDYGDAHYWNVWHGEGDWIHYAKNNCRFSSEFGFAAPAGPIAWDSCMEPEDKSVYSPVSRWHDKTRKGYETYLGYINLHYPEPQTFNDLIYYGQCNQAEAFKFGVEHWRRNKGRCWGTLFWQINDCWSTHSWAVIDSTGDPKAAYYACVRFYAPLLLSLRRDGDKVEAHLVNDGLEPIGGTLALRFLTFDGVEVAANSLPTTAPANAVSGAVLTMEILPNADPRLTFLHATFTDATGTVRGENFLLLDEPKNLLLPNPGLRYDIGAPKEGEAEITVHAERFAAYVWLQMDGDRIPHQFTDNFFHLAPGQSRTVTVRGLSADATPAAIRARLRARHL